MPKSVKTVKRQIMRFAKLLQPPVGRARIHRSAIPLRKQSIRFQPKVTALHPLFVLFKLQLFQSLQEQRRCNDRSSAGFCFCSACINAGFLIPIIAGAHNGKQTCFKVNVVPFQSECFADAQSAESEKENAGRNVFSFAVCPANALCIRSCFAIIKEKRKRCFSALLAVTFFGFMSFS